MLFHADHDFTDERQEPDSDEILLRGLEAFASLNLGDDFQAVFSAKHVV